jgi:tetratricopeptide (TPR) repeat protein
VAVASAGDYLDDVVLDTDAYEPAPFEMIDEPDADVELGETPGESGPENVDHAIDTGPQSDEDAVEVGPESGEEAVEAGPETDDDAVEAGPVSEDDPEIDGDEDIDFDAMLADMASVIEQEIADSGGLDEFDDEARAAGEPLTARITSSELDVGLGYLELGLVEEALADFRGVARHGEQRGAAQVHVGRCLALLGRHDEAVDALQAGLDMVEEGSAPFFDATIELAAVYEQIGAGQAAYQLLSEVARLDPRYRAEDVGMRMERLARSLGLHEG